jgi:hypothetical protein
MTDERDPKVSQRYRELGREEPPGELDAAILAASRRGDATRLAPLVPPTGRRRWYFPVAAAAIITLAVAVTLHVEREQPDAESVATPPPAKLESRTDALEAKKDSAPPELLKRNKQDAPRAPAAAAGRVEQPQPQAQSAPDAQADKGFAMRRAERAAVAEPPERILERIAELRRQGRHDEADKALAEFRRNYPNYRIAEDMLKKVERP